MNALQIDPQTLGARLAEARKSRGLTQEEAAGHLKVSRPTFIAIEKGTRTATADEVLKLAEIYGSSVHEIVRTGPAPVALEPHLRASIGSVGESKEVERAIAELQSFANDYLQLESLTGAQAIECYPSEVVVPKIQPIEFADDVATRERARLNLGDQPIDDLRRLLEEAVGLRIFYGNAPSNIAGMYAFVASLGYCVLINGKHPRERQRWTLAHEYWHFLAERHKPGIDYTNTPDRQSASEKCADAFARAFLMPATAVRRQFLDAMTNRGDFQVADLVRMSVAFGVSVQAMILRFENLGLIAKGTWQHLQESGFKPESAKRRLELSSRYQPEPPYPNRYKFLACEAFDEEKLSEGQFAKLLRTDRVRAREIFHECRRVTGDVTEDGLPINWEANFGTSLLAAR